MQATFQSYNHAKLKYLKIKQIANYNIPASTNIISNSEWSGKQCGEGKRECESLTSTQYYYKI